MVHILGTLEFEEWYLALNSQETEAVDRYIALLELMGVKLGHPYSTAIKGSKYPIRELRISAGRAEIRVFYAFDPMRNALLLVGGNKTGKDRFYESMIPWVEKIWKDYLQSIENNK